MGMLQTFASGLQASLDSWKQIAGQDDEVRECISQAPSLSACLGSSVYERELLLGNTP